jgi:hypothetical protein
VAGWRQETKVVPEKLISGPNVQNITVS